MALVRRLARVQPAKERGSVAVEFAFVLPVLLFCTFGLIEFARVAWTQTTLDYAVQAAARCAAVNKSTCATSELVQQYAVSRAPGLSLPTSTFVVEADVCGMRVTATLLFEFVLPELLPYSQTLRATACYPI